MDEVKRFCSDWHLIGHVGNLEKEYSMNNVDEQDINVPCG